MRLTSIPQLARNANRLREVVAILSRYGLADWISRLNLGFAKGLFKGPGGHGLAELTFEARVRLVLTELGTTFIKFGQMLSTRADLVGPELAQELAALREDAPADPPDVARATVERELGRPVRELFRSFTDRPLASASIGQVHEAVLNDGRPVVVKVQHHGIEGRVRRDLDLLVGIAELAERHVPELAAYRPRATAAEFQRQLLRELDFAREERNLSQFAANFAREPSVRFPTPYPHLSSPRVLTMERLEGVKLTDADRLRAAGHDLDLLARRGAQVFLDMIFRDGFYHADPHPGNIVILEGGVIGLLDCGMVGRLDGRLREEFEDVLLALGGQDTERLARIVTRIGLVPPDLDAARLRTDLAEFLADYANQPLHQLNLSAALTDVTQIIRRNQIVLPAGVALLIKVLIMLEGTSRLLNPKFRLTELLEPQYRRAFWQRLSPTRQAQRLRRVYQEWEDLGTALPRGLTGLVQQLQSGRFDVHLEHKRLEPALNRLAFGILTGAVFLGSALLWSFKVPPLWGEVSLLGALGCGTSFLLGLRLLWAIRKSGHLDP